MWYPIKMLLFYLCLAMWMLPSDSAYGEWPRSGEIDLMESRG